MIMNQVVSGGGGSVPAQYFLLDNKYSGSYGLGTMVSTSAIDIGESGLKYTYSEHKMTTATIISLSGIKSVSGDNGLEYCFKGSRGITSVDCGNIETITGAKAFNQFIYGSDVSSVDFSSLCVITGNEAFRAGAFGAKVGEFRFSSLKNINGNHIFAWLTQTASVVPTFYFSALTPNSFGSYTNQFDGLVFGLNGATVHFPSNIQSVIGSWSDVQNGFDGNNTTVLFDLPSTAHLTGADTVEYERNPKYDTQTALAWRVKDTGTDIAPIIDWTPYYTSGTTDPAVGDTIYSDVGCITAVTTISAIA